MADPGILGWTHVSTYKYKLGCPPRLSVMNQPNHDFILAKTFDLQPEAGKGYNFRCTCWFRRLPLYPRSWELVSTAATKQIPIPKRSQGPWSRHLRIFWSWNGKGVWIRFKNIRWIRLVPQSFGVKRKKSLKAPASFCCFTVTGDFQKITDSCFKVLLVSFVAVVFCYLSQQLTN